MSKQPLTLVGGIGVGAGLMYLLDSTQGARRRSVVRDKAVHTLQTGGAALGKASRDLAHRGKGLALQAGSRLRPDQADDQILRDRVRSKLGRCVSHPSAIEVSVEDGRAILTGNVLASETSRLLKAVRKVRGVRDVENRLQAHETSGDVPSLQSESARTRRLAPATRLLLGVAGGALCATALQRRPLVGAAMGTAGLGLLARGVTNLELRQLVGIGAGRRAVTLHKTININAPAADVFQFWANFENFPFFMSNVIDVRPQEDRSLSHWVVRGPAGTQLEWDAQLTTFEPDRLLAWKTLPGAVVQNAGEVRFSPNETGGTRVDIELSYNPPAGALGHTVATLLGRNPKNEIDEDMVRLKSLIEEGKATADGLTVTRSEVEASFEL